ncbi:MAG: metalloregulator ArsR/SmtB family transcription factor [Chloroflexi bacterium]|nr:metalloregulator ArsR/SmtB family transcription factor [Chloroflexota bacterium]
MIAEVASVRERQFYRLQAELCRTLADPTRLELIYLLGEGPQAVKQLVEATGQRQANISQHLGLLRERGMVQARRAGPEVHYSLVDTRILDACRITRELLLARLARHAALLDSTDVEQGEN